MLQGCLNSEQNEVGLLAKYVKAERRDWTELNWRGLVFDELTNAQAVVHYSRHRLTASTIRT